MVTRRPVEESRQQLLEAGAAMLAEEGVGVRLDRITLIDVSRHAGMKTAGSGYKIWSTQDAFRADLLEFLVARSASTFPTSAHVGALLDGPDGPPSLDELLRVASAANTETNRELYPTYLLVWLAHLTDEALKAPFEESESAWFHELVAMFTRILDAYDREYVPPFDAETLTVALSAMSEGLAIRHRAAPELIPETLDLPTGADGADEPWTPLAIGVSAIFEAFTRPRT